MVHYEAKKDLYCDKGIGDSMTTHHSLIDESFCDVIYDQVVPSKVPDEGRDSEDGDDEFSEDEGLVDGKLKLSNIQLYFDDSLYIAPPIVVRLEEDLAAMEKETAFKK